MMEDVRENFKRQTSSKNKSLLVLRPDSMQAMCAEQSVSFLGLALGIMTALHFSNAGAFWRARALLSGESHLGFILGRGLGRDEKAS